MRKLFLILFLFLSAYAVAQTVTPSMEARFVPDSIAIGQRFVLRVDVQKDIMQQVAFPEFEDNTFAEKFEILSEGELDTVSLEGRTVKLSKEYLMTIFDAGLYSAGYFPVLVADKNIIDTLWSADSLFLQVTTYDIDTTKQVIFDIIEPMAMPLKFGEFSGYLLWGLLIALVLGLIIWQALKYFKVPIKRRKVALDPPHVVAIRKLVTLHHQKLWQNSKHKLYYTTITDILREYLEERYGVGAMEMTTDEIMRALKDFDIPKANKDNLHQLLTRADFVKFAKYVPEATDNENSYTWAYYFVEETKLIEEVKMVDEDEIEAEGETQTETGTETQTEQTSEDKAEQTDETKN